MLLRPAPLARFSSQRQSVSLPGRRCLRRTRTASAWRRRPVTGLVPFVLTSSLGPVMGSGSDIGSGSIGTFRLGLNAHGILSSTAGQVLYQFILICSVSLTDFLCPVARFLAGKRGSTISCMWSLLVPSGFLCGSGFSFFLCFAPWFFRFTHFRALFPLQTTVGPGLILRLIKQYKTCLFDVFCCFCFPFSLLFRSLFYFSGLFLLGSSLSLSSGGVPVSVVPFPLRWFSDARIVGLELDHGRG